MEDRLLFSQRNTRQVSRLEMVSENTVPNDYLRCPATFRRADFFPRTPGSPNMIPTLMERSFLCKLNLNNDNGISINTGNKCTQACLAGVNRNRWGDRRGKRRAAPLPFPSLPSRSHFWPLPFRLNTYEMIITMETKTRAQIVL